MLKNEIPVTILFAKAKIILEFCDMSLSGMLTRTFLMMNFSALFHISGSMYIETDSG